MVVKGKMKNPKETAANRSPCNYQPSPAISQEVSFISAQALHVPKTIKGRSHDKKRGSKYLMMEELSPKTIKGRVFEDQRN